MQEESMQASSRKRKGSLFWKVPEHSGSFAPGSALGAGEPIEFKLGPKLDTKSESSRQQQVILRQVILVKVKPYVTSCGRKVEWQPFYRSTGVNSHREMGDGSAGTWFPFDFVIYQYNYSTDSWGIWVHKERYSPENLRGKHRSPTELSPAIHGIKYDTRFGNNYYRSISYRLGGGLWENYSIGGVPLDTLDPRPLPRENIVPESGFPIGTVFTQKNIDSPVLYEPREGSRDLGGNAGGSQ